MRILLLFVFSGLSTLVAAQTQSLRKLPKPARALLEDYVLIPSGTVTMNIFDGYDSLQCRPPARKSVSAFYMSKYEITVAEYRQFFQASGEPENRYDTTVWTRDYPYSFNSKIEKHYTNHPSYRKYPIVGISWSQAVRYCLWKTEQVNSLLKNTGYRVAIRLPHEVEWAYAALGQVSHGSENEQIPERRVFPWSGGYFMPAGKSDNCLKLNCNGGAVQTSRGHYLLWNPADGGLYTMPVKSFESNDFGLYQMAGNVAEWTSDNYALDTAYIERALREQENADKPKLFDRVIPAFPVDRYKDYKIIKGGSWVDEPFYMQAGVVKIQHPERASSTVGFRPVLIVFKE